MFGDGPRLPLKIRFRMLWREGLLRGPLLRLWGGVGLLLGGGLGFALLQGDLACCGVSLGGGAALVGIVLFSIGLYEVGALVLWAE